MNSGPGATLARTDVSMLSENVTLEVPANTADCVSCAQPAGKAPSTWASQQIMGFQSHACFQDFPGPIKRWSLLCS